MVQASGLLSGGILPRWSESPDSADLLRGHESSSKLAADTPVGFLPDHGGVGTEAQLAQA